MFDDFDLYVTIFKKIDPIVTHALIDLSRERVPNILLFLLLWQIIVKYYLIYYLVKS